eukprot:TRINITY_DN4255_c0_g1_i1.p1 TRINITY_DN4255_c0_g1~~TRINITY_DN4255_c0_g1_i1.p1  ORF type:complete len:533 (+),score=141.59 TRINITY_DN4255_c0_g1_i1:309-1907(+)
MIDSSRLAEKEQELVKLLRSKGLGNVACSLAHLLNGAFIFTDPSVKDNPIVYSSLEFSMLTGYDEHEIMGNNCRFLQGEGTCKKDVQGMAKLVKAGTEGAVRVLNYTKTGRAFWNMFYILPLRLDGKVVLFLGAQHIDCPETPPPSFQEQNPSSIPFSLPSSRPSSPAIDPAADDQQDAEKEAEPVSSDAPLSKGQKKKQRRKKKRKAKPVDTADSTEASSAPSSGDTTADDDDAVNGDGDLSKKERKKAAKAAKKAAAVGEELDVNGALTSNVLLSCGGQVLRPNTIPILFRNEYCSGQCLFKTSSMNKGTMECVKPYFKGRNRLFELQVQFSVDKQPPPGQQIYVGLEIREPLKFGFTSRLAATAIVQGLRIFCSTLYYSMGGDDENGKLTFPFQVLPDSLHENPSGGTEVPPPLTLGDLPVGNITSSETELRVGNTYTLSFYSQYVDFEDWAVVRCPGFSRVGLERFLGELPLSIVAYSATAGGNDHSNSKRTMMFEVEISHRTCDTYHDARRKMQSSVHSLHSAFSLK